MIPRNVPRRRIVVRSIARGVAAVFLLSSLAVGKESKQRIDPRLKQIHTIFLKGHNPAADDIRGKHVGIEQHSCFKLVPDPETADAVMTTYFRVETLSVPGSLSRPPVYHTAIEISVRYGEKMKRIWAKDISLSETEERARHGAWRLMDSLRQDVCAEK